MYVKLGVLPEGENINWGCLRTKCSREYLELRARR